MLDFFQISTKEAKGGVIEVRPDFTVGRSKDLMIQGGAFYAVWDEEKGLWSRDEYDVRRLVDEKLFEYAEKAKADGISCSVKPLAQFSNGGWKQFRAFMKNVSDNSHPLDAKITFANTEVKKTDYASRRLSYSLVEGEMSAYRELTSLLYTDEELAKIEWAIGAVISGDAKKIEKFLVFYGAGGTGKSTLMSIIAKMFGGLVRDGGYVAMFDAKALVGNNNSFSTEAFKDNPLVAIQHDGDLSKIEDNSKLNSVVSHENLRINEKYKATYDSKINALLFMGTNKPVKISDAKSGMIRRLIDVRPTGNKHEADRYFDLMALIEFELGAIAHHCLQVYRKMGKSYYNPYEPLSMKFETDAFFNFVEAHYDIFKGQNGTTLKQAWELYKAYCEEAELGYKMTMYKFREALKDYFEEFHERYTTEDGTVLRSYYLGFSGQLYKVPVNEKAKVIKYSLVLEETVSILDESCSDFPAQYGKADETPRASWVLVKSTLGDLDTSKLHFVKVPENHIVIDFDLKDDNGEKSLERNLEAASAWPPTYGEFSKSGGGVHLHYLYTGGDVGELAAEYSDGIEIKVFRGGSSLRRKLTKCNGLPIASINGGLPFKEKKTMLETKTIQTEKGLRDLIARIMQKEFHSGTKPSIDFVRKVLDDAYASGMVYDLSDLRPKLLAFASRSSNQSLISIKTVQKMKFKSEVTAEGAAPPAKDERIVYFDCEVYPNLFVICWKYAGSDTVVRMINPSATDVESLFQFKLAGYNCRDYDNHILWGAMMGYTNEQLYQLSQRIIVLKDRSAKFGKAYSLSYADVMDYCSVTPKPSLKWWEIKLGLRHMEMDIPWNEPVPPELWWKVVEYCANDVVALEAVAEHCKQDFVARQILADLSGLTVNDTTRNHATKIIFGNDRNPQDKFIYTDLSREFPGYVFDPYAVEKSTYRGEVVGEGGYVYAEPGIYENVALLDVSSMHPTSIMQLDLFGSYTAKFVRLMDARLALKNGNRAKFEGLFPGVAWPETEEEAQALDRALKLVINSIYGFTAATFPNEFKDPRNIDNIVAKRGALFMVDLKCALQDRDIQVVHIKTDSVKIPNATQETIDFVKEFGRKYGYDFNHEATYSKMCLVNDAVFIARVGWTEKKGDVDFWKATGAQFQHPVVFKALFTGEPIAFNDLCEPKQVKGSYALYLDYDESMATPATPYKGTRFVGKIGLFLPVYKEAGGAKLVKIKDDKTYAVAGTKGHLWLEAEVVKTLNLNAVDRMLFEDLTQAVRDTGSITDVVDMSYYENLADEAIKAIDKFGSYAEFIK
jgi:hypothetical protein